MKTNKNKLTGAEIVIKELEGLGVEYIFGYPGGAVIPLFDALVNSSIKLILTRHEQGATHMADGYARSTGKPGVVLVTSGPGATNAVTGILTANMDSVPIIILSGQTITSSLGKDAFQEADIFGITAPIVKHSYLLKDTTTISKVIREAFYISTTNRPGPILIDLPKDITGSRIEVNDTEDKTIDLPGYTPVDKAKEEDIIELSNLLKKSKKPLLLVGHGAVISKANKEIIELAEKLRAPVVTTLLGKGVFPEDNELALGFLGMHGTAYANMAVRDCDFILSIGSRWDDRITPLDTSRFCKGAIKCHIDIDASEINKVIKVDKYIIGDIKDVVGRMLKYATALDTKEWLLETEGNKRVYPLTYKKDSGLRAQYVIDRLYELSNGNAIVTTDVGQHQMWAAQFYKVKEPTKWITSGGAGTMGFGLPSAIGAKLGNKKEQVISIIGDGGFQMTLCELSTAVINNLNIKIVILDNKYLGMVRQWQELFYENRLSGVDLKGNPDFVKLAEAYGVKSFHIDDPKKTDDVIKAALAYNDGPCLIHAEVLKEDNVFPMIPSGGAAEDMIIEPNDDTKFKKPKGST